MELMKKLNDLYKHDPLMFAAIIVGMTQIDIAECTGVTRSQVSNYVQCKSKMTNDRKKLRKAIRKVMEHQKKGKLKKLPTAYQTEVHRICKKILKKEKSDG